ncbi:type 1 periplasmic-binding domain-containing protein [Bifidobacterium xylocopae]|uniref:Periplasmic binding protein domain-containing protein n=1 Tax=Bifidobacterium xylocopae TaxID=2493119 RepID=A0A366KCZ8_9BIFI|nr:hypothetical protein [Bifidobacterium xylocopae]RBP99574.1 hypothetical protein CRD59_03355 [Bifidobacterium xylocopae]
MSMHERMGGSGGWARLLPAMLVLAIMLSCLSGCAPHGRAVGDSWQEGLTAEHDGPDRSAVTVAIVGPAHTEHTDGGGGWADLNRRIFDLLERNGMEAYFTSASDADGQRHAVREAVARRTTVIAVEEPAVCDWSGVLGRARRAGLPVVLIGGGYRPSDQTLYAASLRVDDGARDAVPLGRALQTIADDRRHPRLIRVNLQDDLTQRRPPDRIEEMQ